MSIAQLERTIKEMRVLPADQAAMKADYAKRAAEFKGKLIVIMPVRNEGEWPVKTIRNFRKKKAPGTDLRFFVVDDGSTDGCCKTLHKARDIIFHRNKTPQGQGLSRSLGVYMTRGQADCYVSIDSHMALRKPHVLETIALSAMDTGGIVGTLSGAINTNKTLGIVAFDWKLRNGGGYFIVDTVGIRRVDHYLEPVQLLRGACYAFTEETFDNLGGFHESRGLYGFFERDLAINCYFQNIPVLVNTGVRSWHFYRVKRPYSMGGLWKWQGYVESCRQMFRPKMWHKWLYPAANEIAHKLNDPVLWWLLRTPRLAALQRLYEPLKRRSDEDVLRWMGFPVKATEVTESTEASRDR